MRDDPELDVIRKRGLRSTSSATSPTSQADGPDGRRDRAGRLDRGPRRAASRRRRGDDRRRWPPAPTSSTRRRSSTARGAATPTSCCASTTPERPSRLGPVALRGRRHEARAPRQGQRRPPDLLVHRPARADPGRPARSGCTSRSAAAPGRSSASASTTTWPTTAARRDGSSRRSPTRRRPPTRPPARTRSRSSTATSAAGPPSASPGGAADDHLSLVAGHLGPPAAGAERRAASPPSRRSATWRCRWSRRSRARGAEALDAGPRAGADPARGTTRGTPLVRAARCPSRAEPIEPERGLASLPPPSPGDLFFDIEGDPYALDDGLDYLFGVLETRRRRSTPSGRATRAASSRLDGERRGLRAPDRLLHGAPRAATRTSTSTTTRRTSRPRSSG